MLSAEVNRTAIGVVRKPHGIKGGLKVTLYSIDLDMLQNLEQLFVNTGSDWKQLTLNSSQGYDDFAILNFKEIQDRTEAEAYRDQEIFTLRDDLPTLDDDEFYIDDLIGCEAVNERNELLGKVIEILSPGAHEVLLISNGESETLVPLVDEWVANIDINDRRIQVNSAEELL
ncbi:MAG: 16S rRNA processing protein RimM [Candidatus Marinimicrobia bacterium]|nr:16S rRNA processing protein RimM [Candidatus Neomarinimicrobiota bacterium]